MNQKEFLDHALSVAETLARTAGSSALELQNHLGEVDYKTPKDVVTKADYLSEKIIVEGLKKAFPTHCIRTEEAGIIQGEDPNYLWIIDPIDGTINYSRGIPFWGISIALHFNKKPLLSVVYLPRLEEMYTAILDGGAFLNGNPIQVSDVTNPSQAIVSNGDFNVGHIDKINKHNLQNFEIQANHFQRVKCLGSAVVEGCFVASGRLDLFVMTMSYPWDIAAIALIIKEAGGEATRIDGAPLAFIDGEQAIFSNRLLHQKWLDITKNN